MNPSKDWRTFSAVFTRNLRLFLSYKIWWLTLIIWPLSLLAVNIYNFRAFGPDSAIQKVLSQNYGIQDFTGMVIVGTIVYLLYNRMLWGAGVTIQSERWMGTIEPLFLTPANRLVIVLAAGASSVVEGSWWVLTVFLASWLFFGVQPLVVDWLGVVLSIVATIVALIALGVFFASFFILSRAADMLASGLQSPIRFLSGVTYPVAALPALLQGVAYAIPVTYGIQALRKSLLTGGDRFTILPDIAFLLIFAAFFMLLGHVMVKLMEKRAKRTGSLYTY